MNEFKDNSKGDKAYVAYTFFDEDTAKEIGIKAYTLAPNLLHKLPVRHNLIKLALKRFFDVEAQYDKIKMKTNGYYDGVYFSTSMCERVICVAVSPHPIGIGSQVPFDMGEPVEIYTSHYFHANELIECRKSLYDTDMIFYIYSKKEALRKKFPKTVEITILPQPIAPSSSR